MSILEAEIERLRAALAEVSEANVYWGYWGEQVNVLNNEIDRLKAALENISDNGGDTLTIEDAVRIADAALAMEPKPEYRHVERIAELEAEIERLEAALKTAREALGLAVSHVAISDHPSSSRALKAVEAALARSEPKP
jgi:uncharacterized small protein (DUF1192 family)